MPTKPGTDEPFITFGRYFDSEDLVDLFTSSAALEILKNERQNSI